MQEVLQLLMPSSAQEQSFAQQALQLHLAVQQLQDVEQQVQAASARQAEQQCQGLQRDAPRLVTPRFCHASSRSPRIPGGADTWDKAADTAIAGEHGAAAQ
jgi:hypothetical protein